MPEPKHNSGVKFRDLVAESKVGIVRRELLKKISALSG